jgi:hypothetical protein
MDQLNPNTLAWVLAAFAAAIAALWGFVVVIVMTYRRDARSDRKRCEDANAKLSAEIIAVRDQQTGKLADALETTAIALHSAASAQHTGNAVIDRLCRRIDRLGGAKIDDTPLDQKHA